MQQMLDSNLLFTTTLFQAQLTIQLLHNCNAGIKFWIICALGKTAHYWIHPSSAIKILSQYRFTNHNYTSVICTTESIFTFELAALEESSGLLQGEKLFNGDKVVVHPWDFSIPRLSGRTWVNKTQVLLLHTSERRCKKYCRLSGKMICQLIKTFCSHWAPYIMLSVLNQNNSSELKIAAELRLFDKLR